MKISINKQEFIKWLQSYHPRSKIGIPGSCKWCPIAKFLKHKYDTDDVEAGAYELTVDGLDIDTPKWATSLMLAVDKTGKLHVTAQEVLKILKQ